MGRGHARETLKFNQKGKFVRLGESMRQEAKMEELKKRILESAKKAGLESEMEDQAKVIKVCFSPLSRFGTERADWAVPTATCSSGYRMVGCALPSRKVLRLVQPRVPRQDRQHHDLHPAPHPDPRAPGQDQGQSEAAVPHEEGVEEDAKAAEGCGAEGQAGSGQDGTPASSSSEGCVRVSFALWLC